MSSRRQPMQPVEGLKKPTLPPPTRPRVLTPVPSSDEAPVAEEVPEAAAEAARVSEAAGTETSRSDVGETPKPKSPKVRRPREDKPPVPAASETADTMKGVSVSVPLSVAEAWRDRAKEDRSSQVAVLLDAIVAQQDNLEELVAAAAAPKPTFNDGLFDRNVGSKQERVVGVTLRMKSGNLDVIDRLAAKHDVKKRSQFVATVLAAYLT